MLQLFRKNYETGGQTSEVVYTSSWCKVLKPRFFIFFFSSLAVHYCLIKFLAPNRHPYANYLPTTFYVPSNFKFTKNLSPDLTVTSPKSKLQHKKVISNANGTGFSNSLFCHYLLRFAQVGTILALEKIARNEGAPTHEKSH